MSHTLTSPQAATAALAEAFAPDGRCRIQVCEERAFSKGTFLELGDVMVPGWKDEELEPEQALLNGEYEWTLPDVAAFTRDLIAALATEAKPADADKARRIVDALGGVAIRLGLTHPVFDPVALSSMPFRQATTIISDTSGVLQGGLSFVAQNLHPAARLKVPSVVQMEIVNTSDRFMSNRRRGEKAKRYDMLMDHMSSQAAQRVLLQLELRSSVELERTFLFGDPLRAAFKKDEEQDVKELNLSVPVRSYADRLILEAARQHQAQVSPGHRVMLLTSDQGLARMAITEGLPPLYFSSAKAEALFGRTHAGSNLRPFDGGLTATSFAAILWELATIFGTARLCADDGTPRVSIHAIGDGFAWTPYQSQDDLLWMETHQPGSGAAAPAPAAPPAGAVAGKETPKPPAPPRRGCRTPPRGRARARHHGGRRCHYGGERQPRGRLGEGRREGTPLQDERRQPFPPDRGARSPAKRPGGEGDGHHRRSEDERAGRLSALPPIGRRGRVRGRKLASQASHQGDLDRASKL